MRGFQSVLKSCGDFATVAISRADQDEINTLHHRCGVYTNHSTVTRVLDAIGWTVDADLSELRLLEPAAGNGAFVIEAARRLLTCMARSKASLTAERLGPRIRAFEIHEAEGGTCRERAFDLLIEAGLAHELARRIAEEWITIGDFLLTDLKPAEFTQIAGNPPYVRWSKIPSGLRRAYEARLPKEIAKGDLFLPFLAQGIEWLRTGGRLGFVCSDRWQFMAYADDFRRLRLPAVDIVMNQPVQARDAYVRAVDAYPSILILERRSEKRRSPAIIGASKTIVDAGFQIRVGPALGCTDAYVLGAGDADVEDELMAPWINAAEIGDGELRPTGKRVICLYDDLGRLRDPADFPSAHARLQRYRTRLEARSVVRNHNAPWYRPIDRVSASAWRAPKLLIPELAKNPRVALDASGAVPSHGVYAISASDPNANLHELYELLSAGGLARAMSSRAPRVKGGYVRCYKRFLSQITI